MSGSPPPRPLPTFSPRETVPHLRASHQRQAPLGLDGPCLGAPAKGWISLCSLSCPTGGPCPAPTQYSMSVGARPAHDHPEAEASQAPQREEMASILKVLRGAEERWERKPALPAAPRASALLFTTQSYSLDFPRDTLRSSGPQ